MKQEYAEQVAAKIIEQLEQGTAPWQKPWQPGELRLPYNPTTGKEYKGMNSLWLHAQGNSDPRWMTYNQASAEGAQVRKGEKGSHIVYWKFSDEKKATDEQGKPIIDPETGKQKTIQVQLERPRSFTAVVFNASQIDGLPPLEARPIGPEPERHALAETIMANSGAKIHHEAGDRAFYRPSTDSITLPERKQFETADNYYATALHELGHWTGHPSRLDRDLSHPFGSEGYAREELRAEIASLMIGERLDIGHDPGQHAAYVKSWVKALKEDPREIFRAAADAERISAFVMGFEHEQSQQLDAPRLTAPQIDPEVAAELQRLHADAVPDYSPLESWEMMEAEAKRNGYSAHIDFDPAAGFLITYTDRQGEPSTINTELGTDGKMVTNHDGKRISRYRSNDDESQPEALRSAIGMDDAAKVKEAERIAEMAGGRWKVEMAEQGGSMRLLLQTDSARDALEAFDPKGPGETFIKDTHTGNTRAGYSDWVRDGAALERNAGATIQAHAAMEAKGITVPGVESGLSAADRSVAEKALLVEHFGDKNAFAHSMLRQNLRLAVVEAFGVGSDETASHIPVRSPLPELWSGEARTVPMVVSLDSSDGYTADPDVRQAQPGEQANDWEIEVFDRESGNWQYFTSIGDEAQANEVTKRLNAIGAHSLNPAALEAAEMALPQVEPTGYTVQSRRMVPEGAAQHAGENAVFVHLADGRRAWGFGADDDTAEKNAVSRAEKIGLDAERAPARAVLHEQPEKAMESRTYLAVPYAEKNEAKAQGAKWDKDAKSWYAEAGVDVATSGLARWSLDKPGVVKAVEPETPEKQFLQALKDAGLDIPGASRDQKSHPVADGTMHRVPTTGEKGGGTSGAYAFHKDTKADGGHIYGGFIQNFKTGEVVHWKPEGKTEQLTAEQRAEQATQAAKARQMRDGERSKEYDATATAAKALWDESPAATGDNAYCKAKGIKNPQGVRQVPASVSPEAAALGIRIAKTAKEAKELREADPKNRVFKAGDLLIPGYDKTGNLRTLQSVNPYFKSLMKGGQKAGLFSVAGADDPMKALAALDAKKPLVIAEGYATADTVSRLQGGGPVIVAFDSGNLDSVAQGLRDRFPKRSLLIAADNDHNAEKQTGTDGRPKPNVGLLKAKEAAEKHGGGVMVPKFKDGDKGSDWNDLATANGDEAARRMLGEEMAVAKRDAAVTAERLTTLARTRDMEARNDPTTSADDAKVASERGHAAEVLATAQSQLGEVRSMAADGVTGNDKGTRSPAAVKAGISRKTEAMHDKANDEREHVLNHPQGADGAAVSWKKLPEQTKQAMIEAVKSGREVTLPKDAPTKLKQMAGHEPTPRPRSRGMGAEL